MTGKRAVVALISALLAFGYLFTLNPRMVEFRIYPGREVSTSFALVLFLFFLGGVGVAVFATAFKEALRSFGFWRHQKADQRRDQAQKLLRQGRGHVVLGRMRTARRLLQKAHRKATGDATVALEMARVDVADGRFQNAERRLKVLLEDDPKNPEILAALLEIYRTRNDFQGQVATLSRWLELDPDHLPSLRALRDLYREAGQWGEAVRAQEAILARAQGRESRQGERRTLTELRCQQAQGMPPARAKDLLERLVRDDPPYAPAHAALGDALLALGDRDGAVQAWLRGYSASEQPGLLLRAEDVRVGSGKEEEMLKLYRKLGRKEPAGVLLRARLLLALERPREALEVLEKADEGAGATRLGRLLLGEALFRLGSYDGAARAFRDGALGPSPEAAVTFACGNCGERAEAWQGACDGCGAFNTLRLDLAPLPRAVALPAVS